MLVVKIKSKSKIEGIFHNCNHFIFLLAVGTCYFESKLIKIPFLRVNLKNFEKKSWCRIIVDPTVLNIAIYRLLLYAYLYQEAYYGLLLTLGRLDIHNTKYESILDGECKRYTH